MRFEEHPIVLMNLDLPQWIIEGDQKLTSSAPKLFFFSLTSAVLLSALMSCAGAPETASTARYLRIAQNGAVQKSAVSPAVQQPQAEPVPAAVVIPVEKAEPAPVPVPETETERFDRIDRDVRHLSGEAERSIPELISALSGLAATDREKVRAVYIWMTANIAYNTDSYFRGIPGATDAVGVFTSGKSVCEGYSNLFLELAKGLGLEAVKVHGYAKGYGYREGVDTGGTNHAWNAVRVDGEWQLFDATWGAGHADGKDFIRAYNEFYFDTPPEEFIYSHFPGDPAFQLIDRPVSRKLFFRLPDLDDDDFDAGLDALKIRGIVESGGAFGLPVIYSTDVPVTLIEFPMVPILKSGYIYRIVIETPSRYALVSNNGGNKDIVENRGGRITIENAFLKGKMGIFLAPLGVDSAYGFSYDGFLEYRVE